MSDDLPLLYDTARVHTAQAMCTVTNINGRIAQTLFFLPGEIQPDVNLTVIFAVDVGVSRQMLTVCNKI
jgi:hypothetical protein